ncbi:MAG: RDD family protein [Arenicellales bacterium]|jgi:uncharacterized RDD family membrane protein YckC|nr:RDD family protein [Arenicellales bacterium]MDP6552744.1 RDD family protein [Arenicellales bacterium]MDP6791924.1 RDD family protein [Arenicellales bacterium]MDP6919813.1 RDD family protein [Arenicellales bacterium]|tara:strand:+ start:2059 stop:2805 length:747 start_codon:yes stop_codon:yes gene_type:complete
MKEFRWTGKKEGIVVRGSLESESLDDALAILKGREIEVEELVENDQPPAPATQSESEHDKEKPTSTTTNMVNCLQCGFTVQSGQVFCTQCGTKLPAITESGESDAPEYVGFWMRTWAFVLDTILVSSVVLPLGWMIYGDAYFAESTEVFAGPADMLLSIFPVIATIIFWYYKSATPGKMAISAMIVDAKTGDRPSTGQLIGRYFAYFLSALPLGLGFFWIGWDKQKRGWHDKLAGTAVVRRRRNHDRR